MFLEISPPTVSRAARSLSACCLVYLVAKLRRRLLTIDRFGTTTEPANQRQIFELGGVQLVIRAMAAHRSAAIVQQHGCGCLQNLATSPAGLQHTQLLLDAGAVRAILDAMKSSASAPTVPYLAYPAY